ncbi:hypothetical protein MGYG_06252 [Nannizzia gypsea CBS 118893]|uniref:Alpha and gamma adaptin binding protein p34 n=1 Tax=Arthroderma gypseum (strain ATCC MYA-4604 / CBS 118893) TaxID=535722 RepID=E4UYS0_ARTGP|nr:hypothetical protein MGYG_06252 [Nannizzia gypsea CBS 118893]EFR03250.1 hypothetical protein MGYG_06252 [Nannizzia gypsea CBS 118893]
MSSPLKRPEKAKNKVNQISNPRRLLILAPSTESQTVIPPFLTRLTGQPPILPSLKSDTKQTDSDATIDISDVACTATTPPPASFAGYTTHAPLQLNTKYYSADIPLWVDEVPSLPLIPSSDVSSSSAGGDSASSPEAWRKEFASEEAREVRDAIGAIIVCTQKPEPPDPALLREGMMDGGENTDSAIFQRAVDRTKDLARAVIEVKALAEEERGEIGDIPGVIVLVGDKCEKGISAASKHDDGDASADSAEYGALWWDEELSDLGVGSGLEVVFWDPKGTTEDPKARNEYGELMGIARVQEVLETHQWSSSASDDAEYDLESISLHGDEEAIGGFALEANELEKEMAGLRLAINSKRNDGSIDDKFEDIGDDSLQVEQLEGLMMRVQAIKDMGADLPDQERKKFAAKAIRDLMKDI